MDEFVLIMPSYNPDEEVMLETLKNVRKKFKNIVIVNDGSEAIHDSFFEKLKNEGYIVLTHFVNLGKGRAIKTAFNYVLNNYSNIVGTVTADCDGQHDIKDIIKCCKKLKEDDSKLIIGSRNFDEKQVPFKSRYGNKLTRTIFGLFVGIKIKDTQSRT